MSKFNQTVVGTKTTNLAGGVAYKESNELEFASMLLTSFANEQFYRSEKDANERLKELLNACDKRFVAQTAIYARTKFGMRSITHVVASELAKYISGESWAKDFYKNIIFRPDDITEIISYYMANCAEKGNGKRGKKGITKAMKSGFSSAISSFNEYTLAKYKGEGKGVKMVDVINITHPQPTEAINKLMAGELKSFDTWESELSAAGQNAKSESEKSELKHGVWVKLIKEHKIGYFALLRNLRNIMEQAPDVVPDALTMLTDESLIKKSLVLPFRFTTAYEEIEKINNGSIVRDVLIALNKAVDISLSNVPKFDGDTLVVLDESGSMSGKPSQIGSLFSAILTKANNADLITFAESARYRNINPMDSTISIAKSLQFAGGGTDFHSIFETANKKYDRIIILSDMQGWIGRYAPLSAFEAYKKRTDSNPFVYSFDLQGYGTLQMPQDKVYCLAGFSDKVFDTMSMLEKDKKALFNEIKAINI